MFETRTIHRKPQPPTPKETIDPGDTVMDAKGRVGIVEFIGISPYWPEEKQGILRAYVIGLNQTFADYYREGEIALTPFQLKQTAA